jgi:hypothetical protein
MEHVALVDDHGIPHPGASRFLPGRVEYVDDPLGQLNGSVSLWLRQSRYFIVIRPVAQPPQRFQIAPGLFHKSLGAIAKAKDRVLMRAVGSRNGETQIGK